jgi:hypothetical protein
MYVDQIFDYYDIFRMHEYCDRLAYDEALSHHQADVEARKNKGKK